MAIGILIGDSFTSQFLSKFDLKHRLLTYGKDFWWKKMAQNPAKF
jgi:hypothetical protein